MKAKNFLFIAILIFFLGFLIGCAHHFQKNIPTNELDEDETNGLSVKTEEYIPLPHIIDFKMIDHEHGWMTVIKDEDKIGILVTSDQGFTWKEVTPNIPLGKEITQPYFFLNETHAWLTMKKFGEIQLIYTQDGGENWIESNPFVSEEGEMMGLTFTDENIGWITNFVSGIGMGGNHIELAKTIDGGKNWSLISEESSNHIIPYEGLKGTVIFSDPQQGWIPVSTIEVQPWLFASTNGGTTWERYYLPSHPEIQGENLISVGPLIFLEKNNKVFIVGFSSADKVTIAIYSTTNSNNNWGISPKIDFESTDIGPNGISISVLDAQHVWFGLKNRLFSYQNAQWKEESSISEKLPQDYWIKKVDFLKENEGWLVIGNNIKSRLLYTKDGGKSWEEVQARIEYK
ncbi:hypothetical protein [Caldalkalibacillus mannanilyticus]|uniref:hypothetical protein n=1 Tax=Caldalkalibacillus mannanilyticus TaxID=1418 RepID=UPI000468D228|nr:hypothetical protein [Caldalkalibacillus mannanilyticus]